MQVVRLPVRLTLLFFLRFVRNITPSAVGVATGTKSTATRLLVPFTQKLPSRPIVCAVRVCYVTLCPAPIVRAIHIACVCDGGCPIQKLESAVVQIRDLGPILTRR